MLNGRTASPVIKDYLPHSQHAIIVTPEYLQDLKDALLREIREALRTKVESVEVRVDLKEAARILGLYAGTVIRKIKRGDKIPYQLDSGRYYFLRSELMNYCKPTRTK